MPFFGKVVYGKGIRGLWRQGWTEVPHVMASFGYGIILGIPLYGSIWYRYWGERGDKKRYRMEYTVYRSDDHRWKYVIED